MPACFAGFTRQCDGRGVHIAVWGCAMHDKDRLLLSLLRRDARRPVVALARDLGLSRTATQDRLARLQSSGAIAGFTIRDGDASETAYIAVRLEPGLNCRQLVPRLKEVAAVELAHSVTGPFDMLIRAASTMAEIETARAAIADLPGVAELSTHVVLERHLA